jgi:hypothetical protein
MKNLSKSKIICLYVGVAILIVALGFLAHYFYLFKSETKEFVHSPCLSAGEEVEYQVQRNEDGPSSAKIFIKEKNTNKIIFGFQIENIVPNHYHPYEIHRCGIYLVREFNVDYKKGKPLPNFRMEVWRYWYNGIGEKLVEENDFRVDPLERYIVVEQSYLGQPDYALVIKDLSTKEDIFVLTLNDIKNINPEVQLGSFNLGKFTEDGRYLWGTLFIGALDTAYYRIELDTWKTEVFSPPPDIPSGAERATNFTGWLAYADITSFTGLEGITEQIEEKARREGRMKNLWIYNFFTKEKIKIASADPGWRFNLKWISDTELEYYLPSGERKIYKIQSK